jgi:hypothetical protein
VQAGGGFPDHAKRQNLDHDFIPTALGNDRCPVSCGNWGDALWFRGESIPCGATRINDIGIAFEDAVAEMVLARQMFSTGFNSGE